MLTLKTDEDLRTSPDSVRLKQAKTAEHNSNPSVSCFVVKEERRESSKKYRFIYCIFKMEDFFCMHILRLEHGESRD